jgi:CubicO group peptidase (beta-lactamase class C family)
MSLFLIDFCICLLLTLTSGIEGDHFAGFGRGDDAIERYVRSLADVGTIHPPGARWSYCNSGFVVAGRLAEVLTSTPFHRLLNEGICRPLKLERTAVLAEEMVAQRCAVGHFSSAQQKAVVPPVVLMEYAQAPAGSRTTSTAAELARFAQAHLDLGVGPRGDRIVTKDSAVAMTEAQIARPATSDGSPMQGLGWRIDDWGGKRLIGHGGGTIGQTSFLQAIPADRLVVALLTNASHGGRLWLELGNWLFEELAGVRMAGPPKPAEVPPALSLDRYEGTYERLGVRLAVSDENGALVMATEFAGYPPELVPEGAPPPVRMLPVDEERFAMVSEGRDDVAVFSDFDQRGPRYLVVGGRAARRREQAGN